MSHRKHDDPTVTSGEIRARKQRLLEGGVIFALALSLCIYLGIRFAQDPAPDGESVATAITQPESRPDLAVVAETAEPIASAGTEPAGVVESEVSATRGETLPGEEILPDAPLVVTYSLAEETFTAGRYDEAAARFATYCAEHPDNAWGQYMRGLSLWKAGEPAAASDAFQDALQRKPDHFKSLVNLARVQLDLDEPDAALATSQRAVDLAPENTDALRVQGRAYHNLARPDEAVSAYLAALRLESDDPWTLNNLALIWIEQQQFDRAVAPLARASELAPDAAVIRNNLGTALERTGHLAQARAEFEQAGRLGSTHGEARLARLAAVVIPADEPALDLPTLAAAWTVPTDGDAGSDEVAAVTFDEAEATPER